MNKHRKWIITALILAALALLVWWGTLPPDPIDYISEQLGIDLPRGEVLENVETHGGFHGDGETYVVIQLEEDISEILQAAQYWHPLPMSENVSTIFYGRETDAVTYGAHLTDENYDPILPQIQNGYYYFYDRNSQATDPADDADLFIPGRSFNYTTAVYDAEKRLLYYFKFDI